MSKQIIIAPKKFADNIERLGSLDQQLRDKLVESLAFIGFHSRFHGNDSPSDQWQNSRLPLWQRQLGACAVHKKDGALSKEECQLWALQRAAELVHSAFEEQAEKRESARKRRAEQKAQREAEQAEQAEQAEAPAKGRKGRKGRKPQGEQKAEQPASKPQAEQAGAQALGGTLRHAGNGEPLTLTEEEYQVALDAIMALRQQAPSLRKTA